MNNYTQIGKPRRNKFLETYNLPRLNQEAIDNLNIPITSKETESLIKKLPTKKTPELYGFIGEFY